MVTDGARLYFLERAGNRLTTVQTAVTGGETQPAPVPFPNSRIFDISPDRSAFLIGTIGSDYTALPLWTWPVQGGSAIRVGSVVADNAAWCPDGQQIVYARGGDVRLVNRDGSRDRGLLHVNGRVDWLRWSPDGHRLDFSVGDGETSTTAIWEASADGTDVHPRFTGETGFSNTCCANWTPDGKYFLFSASRDGRFDLWALGEQPSFWRWRRPQAVQLTSSPISVTGSGVVATTPRGLREYAFGYASEFEAARYEPASHQYQRLLASTSVLDLALSIDGQWVAFQQSSDWTLWRARVDGTDRRRLTSPPMVVAHPRWSPDGKTIAFEGRMPGGSGRAYVVGADGGAPEEIMPGQDEQGTPVWSSDGQSVAVVLNSGVPAASKRPTGIYIVDLRTRRSTKVPGSDALTTPLWSPDGRSLTARTIDERHLLQFDVSLQRWVEATSSSSGFGPAVWSADSKYLYIQNPHESGQPVVRLRAGSFSREASVSFESLLTTGIQRCALEDIAPDGSLIVALTRKGTQVYFVDLDLK